MRFMALTAYACLFMHLSYPQRMTRTQIQLPDPLYRKLKRIAAARDLSMAEVIRRGMESYAQTFAESEASPKKWKIPVLPLRGGLLVDPADISCEAEAIQNR